MDGEFTTGGKPDSVKITMTSKNEDLLQTVREDMVNWFGGMWWDKMSRTDDGWRVEAEVKV